MDKQMLEGRLRDRVNKQFKFNDGESTEPFFIDQYQIKDEKVTVWCDGDPMDFISMDECNSWINLLKEIPGAKRPRVSKHHDFSERSPERDHQLPTHKPRQHQMTYAPKIGQDIMSKLSDITMSNIERLQKDDGAQFIPQAQQINKEVSNMIDLAKTELEIIKTMRG